MSISATRAYASTPPQMRRAGDFVVGNATQADTSGGIDGVALTRTEPVARVTPVSSRTARPDAAFLAHLIATADHAPQTRELRRADVADVQAAYRTAANGFATGSVINRAQRMA